MKELKKNESGITLIALIITVLVMLILAGVAISVMIADGSMFDKTKVSVEKYNNAVKAQDEKIQSLINDVDNYFNQYSDGRIRVELSIPYVGTSSCTINVNTDLDEEKIKEYIIYLNNEELVTITEPTYTIENLDPETTYNILVGVKDINNIEFKSNIQEINTRERVYLYSAGNEYETLTGGWKGVGVTDIKNASGQSYSALAPSTIDKRNDYIYCQYYNSVQSSGGLSTTNKIDLTPYKKLIIDVLATIQAKSWYRLLITNDNTKYYNYLLMTQIGEHSTSANTTVDRGLISTDISNINQNAYIVFNYTKGTASTSSWIQSGLYNAWLEY